MRSSNSGGEGGDVMHRVSKWEVVMVRIHKNEIDPSEKCKGSL